MTRLPVTDVCTVPRPTAGARGATARRRVLRGALAAVAIGSGSCVSEQANPVAVRPLPARAVASAVSCTLARGTAATAQCATVATADGATPSEALARVQQRRKAPDARNMQLTIGGQGQYIDLQPTAVSYNSGTQKFVMSLRVRNLLQQPLGTRDLVTGAGTGVSVILETDPTVAPGGGTGVVAFDNPDSTITVTRAGQPIVTYREVVQAAGATKSRDWQFSMPLTVTSVKFDAFVYSTLTDSTASGFVHDAEWLAMAVGPGIHHCGLKANGQVYCWQGSAQGAGLGQLGNGRLGYTDVMQPATVQPGYRTSVGSLAVGPVHACAIAVSNELYCWGRNGSGQLGTGAIAFDNAFVATPQLVNSGSTRFTQVAVVFSSTCALSLASDVWCWGGGGLSGDGSNVIRYSPVNTGLQASNLDGANGTFCAVDLVGEIWCWGTGTDGQLGDSTTTATAITRVKARRPPGVTGWSQVSVGTRHVCAIAIPASARVYCWGLNIRLALEHADSLLPSALVPRPVKPFATFAASVHAGNNTTCGRDAGGTWWCWGNNQTGQLGNGTTVSNSLMSPVPFAASDIVPSKNGVYTCGMVSSLPAKLACWGTNNAGATGTASPVWLGVTTPQIASSIDAAVVAGASSTCVIESGTAMLRCMGDGAQGVIPDGVDRTETSASPRGILGLDHVDEVVVTALNSCTTRLAGAESWCWGRGSNGENGDGTLFDRPLPVQVPPFGTGSIAKIAAGVAHVCAVRNAAGGRELYCWGRNSSGQAGQPSSIARVTSPALVAAGTQFIDVAPASTQTCALRADSTAYCWTGSAPTFTARTMPPGVKFRSITAGTSHFCALGMDDQAYCWGSNSRGQLGDFTTISRTEPTLVGITSVHLFESVVAYGTSTCGVVRFYFWIRCWGENALGAAGLGASVDFTPDPGNIASFEQFTKVFGYAQFGACAKAVDGRMFCWGSDIGDGRPAGTATYTPIAVTPP